MWWWLAVASATPCEADALTEALRQPAADAARALGRDASEAEALIAADVHALVARCADPRFRRQVEAWEVVPVAVQDRATLFLLTEHPGDWVAAHPMDVGPATVWVPQALSLTRTAADASVSLDLLGLDRLQLRVRPGLPVPPPEPPEDPDELEEWEPPIPPYVEGHTTGPPVWTASCWGPAWAESLMNTVCGSIETTEPAPIAVALPSTRLMVSGPPGPSVDHFQTLIWPDHGVTAQLFVHTEPELAQAHAEQAPIHSWVDGSETALVTCSAQWPASQPTAVSVCESLSAATHDAVEELRRLDR